MRISDWSSDVCSSDLLWRYRLIHRLAHLGYGEARGGRLRRAESSLGMAEGEVAVPVGSVGADQRQVADDRLLQHAVAVAEAADLLALRQFGAESDRRVEGRNAGAAGADALGERALRQALQLDPAFDPERFDRRRLLAAAARRADDPLGDRPCLDPLLSTGDGVRRPHDPKGLVLSLG